MKKTLSYSTIKNGKLNIHLNDKHLTLMHLDFEKNNLNLPFSIYHIYQNNLNNKGYGRGFSLNLEQTLKRLNDDTSSFLLTLPDGTIEKFQEIYYYKNDQESRIYKTIEGKKLKRSDIEVLDDGTLSYQNHPIYIDIKSDTGLTLKSDYKDFIGAEKLNFKNEDLLQLENDILQIQGSVEDLNYQLLEYQKFQDNSSYMSLEQARKEYEHSNQQYKTFQLNSSQIKDKENILKKKEAYYQKIKKGYNNVGGLRQNFTQDDIYFDATMMRISYDDSDGKNAELYANSDRYSGNKLENMSHFGKEAAYYNQRFTDEVERLNQSLQENSLNLERSELELQKPLFDKQKTLVQKENDYLEKQQNYEQEQTEALKKYYTILIERTNLQLKQYQLLLEQKKYQKNILLKQIPELYLQDEEGLVYGYNTEGKLCMLFDAYEHQATIFYNDSNQIKEIIDSSKHKIELIYNSKKQLIRMINGESDYLDFFYEGDQLIQIQYPNKEIFRLSYFNQKLIEFCDIDSIGYRLEYEKELMTSLKYFSFADQTIAEVLTFNYLENQIEISSNKNQFKYGYLLDEEQLLTTEYVLKNEKLEKITTHEFSSDHCRFSMTSQKQDEKLLEVSNVVVTDIKEYAVTGLKPYTTDYILYAIVQADSSETIAQGRVTAYCSHILNEAQAHFELRCVMTYKDLIKNFRVSFNPAIKSKQLVAIPITLEKDEEGNVLLPSELKIVVDYTNNHHNCNVDYLALTKGDFRYYEFDEAHRKIFECSSEAYSIQAKHFQKEGITIQKEEITYQYNPKELLAEEIHQTNITVYDVNGLVKNNEFDKLCVNYFYNKQNKIIKKIDSTGNAEEFVYNEKGFCIQKKTYHQAMPSEVYLEEQEYDDGGQVVSSANELGYKTTNQYLNQSLISTTTPNGHILYMHHSDQAASISTDIDGESNHNTVRYEKGRIISYQSAEMEYRYTYDSFGREKELYINDNLYCSFSYNEEADKHYYKTIYADQSGYKKVCDVFDKVLSIEKIIDGQTYPYVVYEYDEKDLLIKEYHYLDSKVETIEYVYIDHILVGLKTKDYIKRIEEELHSSNTIYEMNDTEYQHQLNYDLKDKITSYRYFVNGQCSLEEQYSYDLLNRLKESSNPVITNKFTYLSKNGRTTNLVASNQKKIGNMHQRNQYIYDQEGNIVTKIENHQITKYSYDQLNRLIREDNEGLNETILYAYDTNGNIVHKEKCEYSTSNDLVKKEDIAYNYKEDNDYLTSYQGKEIRYDRIGNPIIYKGNQLKWNQKELKKYKDIEFTYNINHIRTKKKALDKEIEYVLDGSKIIKEKRTYYTTRVESILEEGSRIETYEEEIEYIYSKQGIIGFDYIKAGNKKRYYYNKNILGDILEIYNEEGKLVGKYQYDGYGNQKIEKDIDSIASINPIRYRGYYYDIETGLYYLNSRYYDAEVSRFINMDSIEYMNPEVINGLNLYAYCMNNPVMGYDPNGAFDWGKFWMCVGSVIAIGVGIAFCAAGFGSILGGVLLGAGAGSLINGFVTEASGGSFTAGWVGGAISGALCGVGAGLGGLAFSAAFNAVNFACLGNLVLGVGISFAGGFLGNLAGTFTTAAIDHNVSNISLKDTLVSSVIMGGLNIFAGIGSGMSSIVGNAGKVAIDANSQLALRIIAGSIAASTEALYDLSSYLLSKLLSMFN